MSHVHNVQIYYEDTDVSGLVYHANYLKYCERAREHLLGPAELVRLLDEEGTGFVVYTATMKFREGARLGDHLEIRTTVEPASAFRLTFQQDVWRRGGSRAMVECRIELVTVGPDGRPVPIPPTVMSRL